MASLLNSKTSQALPIPETDAYDTLPQFPKRSPLPFRRTIRRQELRQIIPLSETTIYEMERRGEFPRRFNLTPRCVVWDLAEVEAWIEGCKQAPRMDVGGPDVRLRKTRPVRAGSNQA
jgi:prophage regulatory protein